MKGAAHQIGVGHIGKRMGKHNFELIASTLAKHGASLHGSPEASLAHAALVSKFADTLAGTNPTFDKGRFLAAAQKGS